MAAWQSVTETDRVRAFQNAEFQKHTIAQSVTIWTIDILKGAVCHFSIIMYQLHLILSELLLLAIYYELNIL